MLVRKALGLWASRSAFLAFATGGVAMEPTSRDIPLARLFARLLRRRDIRAQAYLASASHRKRRRSPSEWRVARMRPSSRHVKESDNTPETATHTHTSGMSWTCSFSLGSATYHAIVRARTTQISCVARGLVCRHHATIPRCTRNYRDEGPPRARYLYGLADGKEEHKRLTHHVGQSPVCAFACMSLLS